MQVSYLSLRLVTGCQLRHRCPRAHERGSRVTSVRVSRPAGDSGAADPAITAALAAYAAGQATEHSVLTAIAGARLLIPVVAVAADHGTAGESADRHPEPGHEGADHADAGHGGASRLGTCHGEHDHPQAGHQEGAPGASSRRDDTEMALPTLIGNDGRTAIIAFTGTETLKRWRDDARPVPVPAGQLWPAALAEHAHAVVVDVAGPVPLVVEGARLWALAHGQPPPPAHEDPDIRAAVAAVAADFTLEPGGPEADLMITLKARDLAEARSAAERVAAVLAPRLRRGIAVRMAG